MHAKHEEIEVNFKDIVNRYLLRPSKMMCLEPILTLMTLYLSFTFGLLFLFFEAYPISFVGHRGWSPGTASLPFVSQTNHKVVDTRVSGIVSGESVLIFPSIFLFRSASWLEC